MAETQVPIEQLRVRVDPDSLGLSTTEDCVPGDVSKLQSRAYDAIRFWASVKGEGFNLYASGPPGIGRVSAIRTILGGRKADGEPFDDWVYVNNFSDAHRPRAVQLPCGTAIPFRDAMAELVEDLAVALPAVFESEDYKTRRNAIEASHQSEQEELLGALREHVAADDLQLVRTPMGFAIVPTSNGEIVTPDVFKTWPASLRTEIEKKVEGHQKQLAELIGTKLPALERGLRARIRELDREAATATIGLAVREVAQAFAGIEPIQRHLQAISRDLDTHFHLFLALSRADDEIPLATRLEHPALRRYAVNVLDATAAEEDGPDGRDTVPIVEESEPTLANLVGSIEQQSVQGALITDFTMIKPGALHRANGGYLVLEMRSLLRQPFAWEALKRCLKTSRIRTTSAAEQLSLVSTTRLEPDEIPLSVKVALVGEPRLYYLLSSLDPDFPQLFKILADFDDDFPRNAEGLCALASTISDMVRERELMPFDSGAIAALLEEASRMSDDATKLSLRMHAIGDLLQEAAHWAGQEGAGTARAEHVRRATEARRHRSDRIRQRGIEMIEREIVNVAVDGAAVGQINGLSVISLGDTRFGRPARISARTRIGTGKIIDIEREVKLGGAIHSKGVLILSSFLAARFGAAAPVSLAASIVFEQSYGGVDGDSASSAELYALLSSLADVPIRQSLAVTGAVDQFGAVQAIGGANEKIEGFFEICKRRGLSGDQGVVIPQANVQHLNLRPEIVRAVEEGMFSIQAVDHVDTGIALLTGIEAGERDKKGNWPAPSINGRVEDRLASYRETIRKLAGPMPGSDEGEDDS